MTRLTLQALAELDDDAFCRALDGVFENAPWVARAVCAQRPFHDRGVLHGAMMEVVRRAPGARQIEFLRGHPDLAGRAARAGDMTEASVAEQASAGLDHLSAAQYARFQQANDAYRQRFGFPFIVCVRNHTLGSILDAYDQRLQSSADEELARALDEVAEITRHRLQALLCGDDPGAGA